MPSRGMGPRRAPALRSAEHLLEKALDAMHAGKADRMVARRTFLAHVVVATPGTYRGAHHKALQAVTDHREQLADGGSDGRRRGA